MGFSCKPARIAAAFAISFAVAGCGATETAIPYPKISSVKRITKKILSREEQDKAIEDMTLEQKSHRAEAEHEIEKR